MALNARIALAVAVGAALLWPTGARAQDEAPPPDAPQPEPQPVVVAPEPKSPPNVDYPKKAPPQFEPITVTVELTVDETGAVTNVERVSPPRRVFDVAVIEAAKKFSFEPATADGKPIAVTITFSHTFEPPELPPPPPVAENAEPARSSVLQGRLVTRGTRAPVVGGVVAATVDEHEYVAAAGTDGRFRLEVPRGEAAVTVKAPGYNTFLQRETLAGDEQLAVTYYVEKERYDPYEIVIVGDPVRKEVSRVTLRGAEIKQIPGTFGDPYRVVTTLPGVATVMSLLPFPIVRGASPASTGLLLDGNRVPMLYHMLSGPSVVHPDFIDEVQFYPGGAPVRYGGYTGGIVDGLTARARKGEQLIDIDVNLLQAGGLVRQPVPYIGATATVAARYGYPGAALSLADGETSLSYWDYQLRLDGGNARSGWTVFAFGARDELSTVPEDADPMDPNPPKEPQLILGFHRLDLRARHGKGMFDGAYRLVGGYDHSISAGTDVSLMSLEPGARWRLRPDKSLELVAGVEGTFHSVSQGDELSPLDELTVRSITRDIDNVYVGSALAEALWQPTPSWLIRPGVRTDTWYDKRDRKTGVDPRLTVRYKLTERDLDDVAPGSPERAVWLKASAGVYHQPPRFILPLPGLDMMPLRYGLLRSYQTSVGAEVPMGRGIELTGEAFFNYQDPTLFDLAVNETDLNTGANSSLFPDSTAPPPTDIQEFLDRLIEPLTGRSYGLEFLARRRARNGLFGWISYTLSRSERSQIDASGYAPYDFDRAHLLNVVAGLPLPRNWDVGLRLQYNSGKAATTTAGYNTARTDPYVRFDLRIDKRAVWNEWLLDFYVDITNIAVLPEEITPGRTIRYVLPTAGVRGRF